VVQWRLRDMHHSSAGAGEVSARAPTRLAKSLSFFGVGAAPYDTSYVMLPTKLVLGLQARKRDVGSN